MTFLLEQEGTDDAGNNLITGEINHYFSRCKENNRLLVNLLGACVLEYNIDLTQVTSSCSRLYDNREIHILPDKANSFFVKRLSAPTMLANRWCNRRVDGCGLSYSV